MYIKLTKEQFQQVDLTQDVRVGPFSLSVKTKSLCDAIPDQTLDNLMVEVETISSGSYTYLDPVLGMTTINITETAGIPLWYDGNTMELISESEYGNLLAQYEPYVLGYTYETGDQFVHEGYLYTVIQGHTSQEDWQPDSLPALYRRTIPQNLIAEWVQPTGAHDAYNIGDRVRWNGQTYESTINANVWSPGVTGWVLIP